MTDAATSAVYAPFRRICFSTAELRTFSILSPWRPVLHTILLWAQIVFAWAIVAAGVHWSVALLAIPWVGSRYYALYIIGHDGLHRRLFNTVGLNDLWNDACILGAIGAITRLNRNNHMLHHRLLGMPSDPDLYKYDESRRVVRSRFLLGLTGLPHIARAVSNVFRTRTIAHTSHPFSPTYRLRDITILVSWQVCLVAGLSYAIAWWAYPVLWLIPVYLFTFVMDLIRVFCEHSYASGRAISAGANRLISFRSNWLERQFFSPMNMNLHAVHHLWPAIPYYRLREVDALLSSSSLSGEFEWRTTYVGYLIEFYRQSRVNRTE